MSFLFYKIDDLWHAIKRNRTFCFISVVFLLLGIVLGIIVSKAGCSCWWCKGRLNCIETIFFKSFGVVFFRFFANFLILILLLCLLSLHTNANNCKCLLCIFVGMYTGSYLKLLIANYAIIGLICGILLYVALALFCLLAIVVSYVSTRQRVCAYQLIDAYFCNVKCMYIVAFGLLYAVVVIFWIIRVFVIAR